MGRKSTIRILQPQRQRKSAALWALTGIAAAAATWIFAAARTGRWEQELDRAQEANGAPEPQPGDILLFHHATADDLLITLLSRSPFYHAAIYAGDGMVVESRPRGVVHDSLQGREGAYAVIPAPGGKGREALAWALQQVGAGYDKSDLVVIVLERLFRRLHLNYTPPGNRFTCAEFVSEAYRHAGIVLVPDRDRSDVIPADLGRNLLPANPPQPSQRPGPQQPAG